MNFLITLVALATVASGTPLHKKITNDFSMENWGRIVGGEEGKIEEVPYQISLRAYGSHSCGGSIISESWIVTAGHCVGKPSILTVYAGSTNRRWGGSMHTVAEVVLHEKFNTTSIGIPSNDIALMRVNEPFKFGRTRKPIELFNAEEESEPGAEGTISGWGTTGGWFAPIKLRLARIPIVSKEYCSEAYGDIGGLPAGQICAGIVEGGTDACQGDSGGPLAIDGRLAGITSWGTGCALPGKPGAYTEVAAYRDWIKSKIGV